LRVNTYIKKNLKKKGKKEKRRKRKEEKIQYWILIAMVYHFNLRMRPLS